MAQRVFSASSYPYHYVIMRASLSSGLPDRSSRARRQPAPLSPLSQPISRFRIGRSYTDQAPTKELQLIIRLNKFLVRHLVSAWRRCRNCDRLRVRYSADTDIEDLRGRAGIAGQVGCRGREGVRPTCQRARSK